MGADIKNNFVKGNLASLGSPAEAGLGRLRGIALYSSRVTSLRSVAFRQGRAQGIALYSCTLPTGRTILPYCRSHVTRLSDQRQCLFTTDYTDYTDWKENVIGLLV